MLMGLAGFTVIVGLALLVSLFLLGAGREFSAKSPDTEGKLAPYACGEPIPAAKVRLNMENFFIYAVFFMIFDVLGFVVVTSMHNPGSPLLPLFYVGTSLVSVLALNTLWRS